MIGERNQRERGVQMAYWVPHRLSFRTACNGDGDKTCMRRSQPRKLTMYRLQWLPRLDQVSVTPKYEGAVHTSHAAKPMYDSSSPKTSSRRRCLDPVFALAIKKMMLRMIPAVLDQLFCHCSQSLESISSDSQRRKSTGFSHPFMRSTSGRRRTSRGILLQEISLLDFRGQSITIHQR